MAVIYEVIGFIVHVLVLSGGIIFWAFIFSIGLKTIMKKGSKE